MAPPMNGPTLLPIARRSEVKHLISGDDVNTTIPPHPTWVDLVVRVGAILDIGGADLLPRVNKARAGSIRGILSKTC
jgi:hypothetical protein